MGAVPSRGSPRRAHVSGVGAPIATSRTHVDFDPRDFGHSKLSTLVEDQPYLRTRTEGRTMEVSLVRRRSRRAEG